MQIWRKIERRRGEKEEGRGRGRRKDVDEIRTRSMKEFGEGKRLIGEGEKRRGR